MNNEGRNIVPSGAVYVFPKVPGPTFLLGRPGASWRRRVDRCRRAGG